MAERSRGRTRNEGRRDGEQRIDQERGVFMISVAAELAHMHPQTLRMYEARGLITPKRSPKNTRLYSQADVERLRRIQQMTNEEGLNLAGVETVLDLEQRRLVGDGPAGVLLLGRAPPALEPDRPAAADRLRDPPSLDRGDAREQPLAVGAVPPGQVRVEPVEEARQVRGG